MATYAARYLRSRQKAIVAPALQIVKRTASLPGSKGSTSTDPLKCTAVANTKDVPAAVIPFPLSLGPHLAFRSEIDDELRNRRRWAEIDRKLSPVDSILALVDRVLQRAS